MVLQRLGEPAQKRESQYWAATGTHNQEWRYPSRGLTVQMEADTIGSPQIVRSVTLVSPGKMETEKSVGIGTDSKTVKSIYIDRIDKETSSDNTLVIGSIYDRMVMTFENNAVVRIIIGAAAE